MKNDPKRYAIVEVKWKDAVDFSGLQESVKDLATRMSVGYLVRDDKRVIGVCSVLDVHNLSEVDFEDTSEGHLIPRQWIEELTILREAINGTKV